MLCHFFWYSFSLHLCLCYSFVYIRRRRREEEEAEEEEEEIEGKKSLEDLAASVSPASFARLPNSQRLVSDDRKAAATRIRIGNSAQHTKQGQLSGFLSQAFFAVFRSFSKKAISNVGKNKSTGKSEGEMRRCGIR